MGVNKAILLGNVGKEPTLRHLNDGTPVCNFTMATNERYKDRNGERKEVTEWHNIVLWRRLAEIANEYVKKGTKIYLEGKIQTRQYQDKEGNTKYITEIVGNKMELLNRAQGGGSQGPDDAYSTGNLSQPSNAQSTSGSGQAASSQDEGGIEQDGADDDLPF